MLTISASTASFLGIIMQTIRVHDYDSRTRYDIDTTTTKYIEQVSYMDAIQKNTTKNTNQYDTGGPQTNRFTTSTFDTSEAFRSS